MWTDNRLLKLLGLDQPIVLAPMASATGPEIVAAVSNVGALGSFGAASTPPDRLREVIADIRGRTDRPFNINLFSASTEDYDAARVPTDRLRSVIQSFHDEHSLGEIPQPSPMFGPASAQLDVLVELKVPVISFHFGVDASTVDYARSAGARVLCSATTVAEARLLEQAGVDVVIAQGAEAGGHRGTFDGPWTEALIGTLALVPQVVDAVDVPVIAAGGIMDARGVVACLALGACAAQLGTAFLTCPEAPVSDAWREQLLKASATRTKVTEAISGKPARGLANRYIDTVEQAGDELLPYPAQYSLSRNLRQYANEKGDPDFLAMWAGQGVGLAKTHNAAAFVRELVDDSASLIQRLSQLSG